MKYDKELLKKAVAIFNPEILVKQIEECALRLAMSAFDYNTEKEPFLLFKTQKLLKNIADMSIMMQEAAIMFSAEEIQSNINCSMDKMRLLIDAYNNIQKGQK
jgi:hypothetical protein